MTSPQLVLAWLLLAHLLADFVLQTDAIAVGKFGDGRPAWRALGIHTLVVAAVNAPLVLVFGWPGLVYVILTAGSHLVIDRTKIVFTLRQRRGRRRDHPGAPRGARCDPRRWALAGPGRRTMRTRAAADGTPFDRSWSPLPAALFAADQLAHLAVLAGLWLLLLSNAAPLGGWVDVVNALLGSTDRGVVQRDRAAVRGAAGPRHRRGARRLAVRGHAGPGAALAHHRVGREQHPSPARIGATIGILERLLICALMLAGAVATIGLVVAAKTLARFKQLDDREFAEYYLLGTLASVSIAVIGALVAQAALA